MNFTDAERAALSDFDNATIEITRESSGGRGPRGEPIAGAPIIVLANQPCQIWDLNESDKAGLTGEEITLRRKVRLNAYHPEIDGKMTAILDGRKHNIIAPLDDGTRSFSILTLRLVTS